jgi:hypothetical protein
MKNETEMKAGQSGPPDYRGRERYGMAVAVSATGRPVVISGPIRIDAYAGETITWTLVNASEQRVVFEMADLRPMSEGPESPFVEELPPPVPVEHGLDKGAKRKFVLTVKPRESFRPEQITRYQYVIRIQGVPNSAADPELDIYP